MISIQSPSPIQVTVIMSIGVWGVWCTMVGLSLKNSSLRSRGESLPIKLDSSLKKDQKKKKMGGGICLYHDKYSNIHLIHHNSSTDTTVF